MRKHLPIILLLIFSAAIYITTYFQLSLADNIDSSHAIAAREILQRNDWVTLHINGVRYLEKAPLLYWLVAISYQCFGINEFAVRFPTIVAVVLLAGSAYIFGRWAYSQKAGLYAAVILVSCFGMFLFTRTMIPEALLTLWFTVAHFCFLRAFLGKGKEKRFYYGFYAAMALAVMSKGLIGIVFSVGPVFFFLLLTNQLRAWKELRLVSGGALFLAIALPWHLLVGLRNENFFWFYFINEHVLRFLNKRSQRDYNRLPVLQYWLLHLVWLFPWSFGLPLLLKQRFRPKSTTDRQAQINLYLLLWAGIVVVFFGLSSNHEYYTFPAYPALALLLGEAFATAEVKRKRFLLWMNGILGAVALAAAAIFGVLLWNSREVRTTGDLSDFLNLVAADSEHYTRFFGYFLDLTTQAFAELRGPAIGAALVLSIGFLVAFWFRRRRQHGRVVIAMVVAMWLLFICSNSAHVRFEPVLSSRVLANEIMQRWEPGAKIAINGNHEIGSSIGFYTNQQLLLLNGRKFNLEFGSRYPDAPPVFITNEDLRRLWRTSNRVFLFTENIKKEALLKNLNLPVTLVAERGGKSVLTNKPL
ncbi:MAG: ArnT family glycosyltransferase [Xenococcaceae cyanobacterium]